MSANGNKVTLFELDIDHDALIQKSAATLREMEKLQDSQRELKKTSKDLREAIKVLSEKFKDPNLKKNSEEYKELQKQLRDTQKEYVKTSEKLAVNQTNLKEVRKEYNLSNRVLNEYSKTQKDEITIIRETDGSIEQLQVALAKNRKEYRKLSKEQRENTKEGKELNEVINAQDAEYKKLQTGIGVTQVKVGGYDEALSKLHPTLGGIYSQLIGMRDGLQAQTEGLEGSKKGFKAFNLILKASIIGLIVAAVGFLINQLMKMQPVLDKTSQIFAGMNAVLEVTVGFFSKVVSLAGDVLTGQKSLSEAWKEGTEIASNLGKAIKDAYDRGAEIERQIQATRRLSIEMEKQVATLELESEKYKAISDDNTRSFKEREDALKKSIELEAKIASQRLTIAQQELTNLRAQQSLKANITDDDRKAEADLVVAVRNAQKEIQKIRMDNLKAERELKQDRLEKDLDILIDGFDNVKTINDKIIESDRTTLEEKAKLIKETSRLANESFLKQIEVLQQLTDKTINANALLKESNATLLNEKIRALGLSEIGETRLLEVIRERRTIEAETAEQLRDIAQLRIQEAESIASRELEIYKRSHKSRIDSEKFLSEEIYNAERERLLKELEQEMEFQQKRLELGTVNQQEYEDAVWQVKESNRVAQEELRKEREEAIKEQKLADLEIQNEIDQLEFDNRFALESARLEQQRQRDIANAERTGADITAIKRKYALEQNKIEQDIADFKGQMNSQIFAGMVNLFGRSSKIGKYFAAAQILNDSIMNASKAFTKAALYAADPLTAPLAINANIQGGIILATGAAQIAKLAFPKGFKAEHGAAMRIGGKRHSQGGTEFWGSDGTHFEAEKDETMFILNRQASAMLAPLLSDINKQYGGVALSNKSAYLASGGSVRRGGTPAINVQSVDPAQIQKIVDSQLSKLIVTHNVLDAEEVLDDLIEVETIATL